MTTTTRAIATLATLLLAATTPLAQPPERPNFIIILTDDQGYADVGVYGAQGFQTPHLDQMASEGIRFTNFYVSAPACTPSRASLLTGAYAPRVSLPNVLNHRSNIGLNPDETTIPELLKPLGYATACFGKWHLGHHQPFLPLQHGFDEFHGIPYSNDMWPHHPQNPNYPDLPLIEGNQTIATNPDQTQFTKTFTQRAINFIHKHKDQPFFLYLPHPMPHVPLFTSQPFQGISQQGPYGDVITEIDWSVGQIIQTLRELNLHQNTLLILTSDNGPWLNYGNHAGSAAPFREGKGTTFEGGMRVPFIAWWPGTIPPATINHQIAATIDILPTIAALANTTPPQHHVIDGHDITPLLTNQPNAPSPHDAYFYHNANELQAVRAGKWKLHRQHTYRHVPNPGKDGQPGPQEQPLLPISLYDLQNDPAETTNLAQKHPQIVTRLLALMDAFEQERTTNTRPPGRIE